MSKLKSADPLTALSVRLPNSLVQKLKQGAIDSNISLSDYVRPYFRDESVKPIGNPTPRRRQPKELGKVSGVDPEKTRLLAKIAAILNEIARAKVQDSSAKPTEPVELLIVMRSIEIELSRLAN